MKHVFPGPQRLRTLLVLSNSAPLSHCSGAIDRGFWIAGHRLEPLDESTFAWKVLTPSGYVEQPMEYTNWNSGEPNNYQGAESCVIVKKNSYTWNDAPCSRDKYYLCEYETVMHFGYSGPGDSCSGYAVHLLYTNTM